MILNAGELKAPGRQGLPRRRRLRRQARSGPGPGLQQPDRHDGDHLDGRPGPACRFQDNILLTIAFMPKGATIPQPPKESLDQPGQGPRRGHRRGRRHDDRRSGHLGVHAGRPRRRCRRPRRAPPAGRRAATTAPATDPVTTARRRRTTAKPSEGGRPGRRRGHPPAAAHLHHAQADAAGGRAPDDRAGRRPSGRRTASTEVVLSLGYRPDRLPRRLPGRPLRRRRAAATRSSPSRSTPPAPSASPPATPASTRPSWWSTATCSPTSTSGACDRLPPHARGRGHHRPDARRRPVALRRGPHRRRRPGHRLHREAAGRRGADQPDQRRHLRRRARGARPHPRGATGLDRAGDVPGAGRPRAGSTPWRPTPTGSTPARRRPTSRPAWPWPSGKRGGIAAGGPGPIAQRPGRRPVRRGRAPSSTRMRWCDGSVIFSGARVGPEARVRGSILGHDVGDRRRALGSRSCR